MGYGWDCRKKTAKHRQKKSSLRKTVLFKDVHNSYVEEKCEDFCGAAS